MITVKNWVTIVLGIESKGQEQARGKLVPSNSSPLNVRNVMF